MSADVAIGMVRTYAHIGAEADFTYQRWMNSIRKANTFATCGPLMEFSVEGKPPGSRIKMSSIGGTVNVSWEVASAVMPMTRLELIVNGEVCVGKSIGPDDDDGQVEIESSFLRLVSCSALDFQQHVEHAGLPP